MWIAAILAFIVYGVAKQTYGLHLVYVATSLIVIILVTGLILYLQHA
jgi:hypothetical protein